MILAPSTTKNIDPISFLDISELDEVIPEKASTEIFGANAFSAWNCYILTQYLHVLM